jgi:hypothetical protein
MPRKISAKEFLADARSGMTDLGLMDKYDLSSPTVQSLFRKLVESGLMSREELEERLPLTERSVTQRLYRCPVCKMPQFMEFDECPQCGVIVNKVSPAASQTEEAQAKPEDSPQGVIAKPPETPQFQMEDIGYEPFASPPEDVEPLIAIDPDPSLNVQPASEEESRQSNTIKISVQIPMDMLDQLNTLGGGLSEHVIEAVKNYLAERGKSTEQ